MTCPLTKLDALKKLLGSDYTVSADLTYTVFPPDVPLVKLKVKYAGMTKNTAALIEPGHLHWANDVAKHIRTAFAEAKMFVGAK